jgi:hypothetical protein
MGLTCSIDGAAGEVRLTGRWGRYRRERGSAGDKEGGPGLVWRRYPDTPIGTAAGQISGCGRTGGGPIQPEHSPRAQHGDVQPLSTSAGGLLGQVDRATVRSDGVASIEGEPDHHQDSEHQQRDRRADAAALIADRNTWRGHGWTVWNALSSDSGI